MSSLLELGRSVGPDHGDDPRPRSIIPSLSREGGANSPSIRDPLWIVSTENFREEWGSVSLELNFIDATLLGTAMSKECHSLLNMFCNNYVCFLKVPLA